MWSHQSSQDPCWGEGWWRLGRSPLRDALDQGAVQTRISAALPTAPHRASPPVKRASGPDSSSLEEHEPLSVLCSGVAATGCRVRTPGCGPKVVVDLWSPRALAALPARRL